MTRVYCLGQVRAISTNCYRCNHTTEEYIRCPYFVDNATHDLQLDGETLEEVLRKWVGRTGLEEEQEI